MNFDQKTPIYLQLAEMIRQDILSGALQEEQMIPSVRKISIQYELNPQTVLNATQLLIQEGLLEKRRGLGLFVLRGARNLLNQAACDRFRHQSVPDLVKEARILDISKQELIALVRENYKEDA
jgi:DNA-binding transcriptional regulator YhcF (GntR family)